MTELQINQLIHEKVMGKCWHEDCYSEHDEDGSCWIVCRKCWSRDISGFANPSYTSSWADYGPMIKECMKKEWWSDFAYEWDDRWIGWIREYLFNPLNGTTAIAEFVEANQQCFKGE